MAGLRERSPRFRTAPLYTPREDLRVAGWIRPCGVLGLAVWASASVSAQTVPTFTRDVGPILDTHCVSCHRPDGDAPFSLLTFADARRRASQIAAVTRARVMPPWQADPEGGPFVGERRLDTADIDLLRRWADAGAPEGPSADSPPVTRPSSGWLHGTPDLVLPLDPYTLRADGPDVFRNFTVHVPGTGSRYVRGLQFRPGTRAVHHANIRVDPTPASRRLDDADPDGGYEGPILRSADFPEGHFLGWTPGQAPPLAPPALAWPLREGSDLVVQLHLYPTGKPERVQPVIGLYFASQPGTQVPSLIRLGRQDVDLAPGRADHLVVDSFTIPVDVQVLAIQPHAHYRATSIRAWATLPDGAERPLLRIAEWNFAWQDQYRYATPFWLPAGTTLRMEYRFDNSADNVRNPDRPPRRVEWGWRSTDEMADVWIQVMTRSPEDRARFDGDARRKMANEDVVGSELLVSRTPGHVSLRNDAATLYMELGRPADALRHFTAARALEPRSAAAWFNEGVALEALGRLGDAADRYQKAVDLEPSYSAAHNNIGNLLAAAGRRDAALAAYRRAAGADPSNAEALANLGALLVGTAPEEAAVHLEAALRLRRDYPEAHFTLARALTLVGRPGDAVSHYRAALSTRPDWAPALVNLAWLLSAHADAAVRRPREGLLLAERAVGVTGRRDATALDVLAVALAANGRFEAAAATGGEAATLADADGQAGLAADMRARAARFARQLPFIVGAP